jgi:hypothetical protein
MKLELQRLEIPCEQVSKRVWRTLEPFSFWIDGKYHRIPAPFFNDKYSVIFDDVIFYVIGFPRDRGDDAENMPAVLHDYLVRYRKVLGLSLMDCHELFKQSMGMASLPPFTIVAKYSAVVCFNWIMAGPGDGTPPRKIRKAMQKASA